MGRPFDINAVQWVRYTYRIPSPSAFQPGELSVAEVAARLGISTGAVYDWIAWGHLVARRTPTGRLCIAFSTEVEEACRKRVVDSCHIKNTTRKESEVQAV